MLIDRIAGRVPPEGVWLPLVTPFRDHRLDEESLATLVYHYATSPIAGLILAATTGEALTLEPCETETLVDIAASITGNRLPLYLGLCGSNTAAMVRQIIATASWPVQGYLISCPYYIRPSQDGLRRHFAALAGATDRPILLYNIPYRTGVNLANETLFQLAEIGNIVGVKDCCADHAQSFELIRGRPADFAVLTGDDAEFFGAIAQGADGGILAAAHIDPEAFAEVRQLLLAGDRTGALRSWRRLVDLVRLLFAEPSPAPIKYWLWREGLIASPEVRLPMTGISGSLAARINHAIEGRMPAAPARIQVPA